MHLMCLVLHLAADLALAAHLVTLLLLLLLLLVDSLIEELAFFLGADFFRGSVYAAHSVNLEGDRFGLQFL